MKTTPKIEIYNNVGGISYYLKKMLMTPCLDCHSTTDLTPTMLSKPEIEFDVMEEMYVASCMHTCAEKTTF